MESEHVADLVRILDEIVLVKNHGILPYPKRGKVKCSVCPFREPCFSLDTEEEVVEPGSWLEGRNIALAEGG